MQFQKELFDGFVRLRNCRRCKRKLHNDPQNKYATRGNGLCYACLREFETSRHWTVEGFIEESIRDDNAVIELELNADLRTWLNRIAKRHRVSVETVILRILETRRTADTQLNESNL